jgi:hypothetical protein
LQCQSLVTGRLQLFRRFFLFAPAANHAVGCPVI